MRILLAAIVLLCGCGLRPAERLDVLFDAASDDLHAGELAKAQLAAEHGISAGGLTPRCGLPVEVSPAALRNPAQQRTRRGSVESSARRCAADAGIRRLGRAQDDAGSARPLSCWDTWTKARPLLDAAHQAAEAAKAEDVLLEIETIQGIRLYAPPALRRSGSRPAHCPGARPHSAFGLPEAAVQINLGMIRVRRLRYDEAIPYFEKAAASGRAASRERSTRWRAATWRSAIGNWASTTVRSKFICRAWRKTNAPAPKIICKTRSERPVAPT